VANLPCGANVPTCSSWDFDSGTVEGWKIGNYYDAAEHGMTTGLSTVVTNGSPALTAKYDNRSGGGWAAEFSVDLCPNVANLNLSNYNFKFDVYLKTNAGSRFSAGTGAADTFVADGRSVILSCMPLNPASDVWLAASCASLPTSVTNMTVIFRFFQDWAGDIYVDNVRFEPK
jgi:hypothetical protein